MTANSAQLPSGEHPYRVAKQQKVRIQRLGMSFLSQGVTFLMVAFCWLQDKIPLVVLRDFVVLTVVINGAFFFIFYFDINLRFKEKSLTGLQMVAALFAPAWVVYFLQEGQARASMMFIAIVAALYGIFSLNTRQFLGIALIYLLIYGGLVLTIWVTKPQFTELPLELMQAFTFTLVMAQIAVIGGYINRLKSKLRDKNKKLNQTMDELQEALEQIHALAQTDELTGISNRRNILQALEQEVNRHDRSPETFSIAMLDVDHFKLINDNYGHPVGDQVLKDVASKIKTTLRTVDFFGRYGGEEFLLIMPQTAKDGAKTSTERIREALANSVLDYMDADYRVTISIGVAEHKNKEKLEELIARADKALYAAKNSGRDRVVVTD